MLSIYVGFFLPSSCQNSLNKPTSCSCIMGRITVIFKSSSISNSYCYIWLCFSACCHCNCDLMGNESILLCTCSFLSISPPFHHLVCVLESVCMENNFSNPKKPKTKGHYITEYCFGAWLWWQLYWSQWEMHGETHWMKEHTSKSSSNWFFYFFCPSILFVCLFEKCLSVIGHQQAVTAQEQVVQQPERSLVWLSWLHVEASLNIILNPIFFLISRLAHCIVAIERLYKKIYRNARQFTISDICLRLPHSISIFLDVVMLDSSVFLCASPIDVMFYSSYKKRRDSGQYYLSNVHSEVNMPICWSLLWVDYLHPFHHLKSVHFKLNELMSIICLKIKKKKNNYKLLV